MLARIVSKTTTKNQLQSILWVISWAMFSVGTECYIGAPPWALLNSFKGSMSLWLTRNIDNPSSYMFRGRSGSQGLTNPLSQCHYQTSIAER